MLLPYTLAAVGGYFLGSLPFGWGVARLRGVDIFAVGSKSSGATNVGRVLGPRYGRLVFVLDVLKGAAAAAWPQAFLGSWTDNVLGLCLVSLIAALLGHSFSCFTRFRGGKGVATGTGGFVVLLPVPLLIAAAVWLIVFYATRYVSLASILAAVALPLAAYFFGCRELLLFAAAAVSLFVIVRHRANIVRLINGTENRFARAGDRGGRA